MARMGGEWGVEMASPRQTRLFGNALFCAAFVSRVVLRASAVSQTFRGKIQRGIIFPRLEMVAVLVAALLFLSSAFAVEDIRAAEKNIHNHLAPLRASGSLCGAGTSCCNVTSTQSCPISAMAKDKSTLVLPGGETRCIFSTSSPFAFQVIPGASDKLLFYFQGGGACWDKYSTDLKLCTTDASPQSLVGIFDRSNANNHFKDFTIVHVLYCSGDVHGGNVVRPYTDSNGQPVTQKGLANAQSALDWTKKQISSGALASKFDELVVMGCSAGSLGAQIWAQQVLATFKYSKAAVVPDSYAGVFPPGSIGPLINGFGYCTAPFLSSDIRSKCNAQTLDITDIDLAAMSATPSIPYVFLQSKVDIVQQSFYISVAISVNASQKTITPTEFYTDVNNLFGTYNSKEKSFLTYLVNGDHHCFTNQALYYTADPISSSDNGASTKSPLMYQFVNNLPLSNGESLSTVCDGVLQGGLNDNTYCSTKVAPKTFTEKY